MIWTNQLIANIFHAKSDGRRIEEKIHASTELSDLSLE